MKITINFDYELQNDPSYEFEKEFNLIAKETFKYLKIKEKEIYFDVSFVSEQSIQQINKQHRNKDYVTDVISFALWENGIKTPLLGELFICTKKAQQQANEYNHSFKREICFLFLHGLLHMLGYNHIKKEDEEIMFSIQDKILYKLNIMR